MLDSAPQYPVPSRFERCLDLIFPPLCVECRRVGRWICTRCWTTISWLSDARCGVCGSPSGCTPCPRCADRSSSITSVLAVAAFEGVAREAVHALKYEGKHAVAPMMGRLMARAAYELGAKPGSGHALARGPPPRTRIRPGGVAGPRDRSRIAT